MCHPLKVKETLGGTHCVRAGHPLRNDVVSGGSRHVRRALGANHENNHHIKLEAGTSRP